MKLFPAFSLVVLSIAIASPVSAQLIVNGSFENNTGACALNQSNSAFDSRVSDVLAYGVASQLDLVNFACGFGGAQDGNFFLGLSTDTSHAHDGLTLHLSQPLAIGTTYNLTYFVRQGAGYASTPYSIGYTTNAGTPGTPVASQAGPLDTLWHQQQVSFTPASAATDLSIEATGILYGWTLMDHFVLTEAPTAVGNASASESSFGIVPNPASGTAAIRIHSPGLGDDGLVRVIDLAGRLLKQIPVGKMQSVEIGLDNMAPGVYLLQIVSKSGVVGGRLIVQ